MNLTWPQFFPTILPPGMEAAIGKVRQDRFSRMVVGLWLLNATGWSLVDELSQILVAQYGLAQRSSATRDLFYRYLPDSGLATTATLPHFIKGLKAIRLTELGRRLCSQDGYGWEMFTRESEWGRLIRLHDGERQQEHTALVLKFAQEARLRGYRVQIVPDMEMGVPAEPDLYVIDHKRRRAYIEVETTWRRGKARKWWNQYELQGFVAVVAKTPATRRTLVEEIKALGLPGKANDLDTLRGQARIGNLRLFHQRWDENGREQAV